MKLGKEGMTYIACLLIRTINEIEENNALSLAPPILDCMALLLRVSSSLQIKGTEVTQYPEKLLRCLQSYQLPAVELCDNIDLLPLNTKAVRSISPQRHSFPWPEMRLQKQISMLREDHFD
jgi:hypothetical protein